MINTGRLFKDSLFVKYLPNMIKINNIKIDQMVKKYKKGILFAKLIKKLPILIPSKINTKDDCILLGERRDLSDIEYFSLYRTLKKLRPWRKGPYKIFGISLDSEWNSYIKWDRIKSEMPTLEGKRILDIGSSNGYYMFRMISKKPKYIIGLEPYLVYYFQYLFLERYIRSPVISCLPIRFEEMPDIKKCFDVIFCMGVLYHRKFPLVFLQQIYQKLVPGGHVIIETLVTTDKKVAVFVPEKTYAKSKNIYFIPSLKCLHLWLKRVGFSEVKCIDVSKTTFNEQQRTQWTGTESLEDFLDPYNPRKTIEGYDAPNRAILICNV